ncbi:MAG: LysM peptidoglycan-binding domain-containing protein [Thermoflexus hugenholtzii]|uniref:LysM peptidoglycan-binding domain-containing protein n=1 Tax=Thermoflexus TaxID=1495649 RepID=UPI001C74FD1F|nr:MULTISPECIES: LysM domain-containing protein [Thermoflexus]QWK09752.1 MAG: LysM peptidoglycan-binding domain-containing protein [Thermoflexus hugenholtzii]
MVGKRMPRALPWLGLAALVALTACRPTRSRSGPVPTATPPGLLFGAPTATATVAPAMPPTPTLLPVTPIMPEGAPTPTPFFSPLPPPTPVAPAPTAAPPAQVTHVVQPGETLFRIALRYGTTVEAIARANNLINPDFIVPGQRLVIPVSAPATGTPTGGERVYIVQPGDNLFRIGLKFNMLWTVIAARNGITNPNAIYPGQRLIIPSP